MQDTGMILKLREAAELLRINPESLRRLSESGKVNGAFKIGKLWRYHRPELIGKAEPK